MHMFKKVSAALAVGLCLMAGAGAATAAEIDAQCRFNGCTPGFNTPDENTVLQNRAIINDEGKHGGTRSVTNIHVDTENVTDIFKGPVLNNGATSVINSNSTSVDASSTGSGSNSVSITTGQHSTDANQQTTADQATGVIHTINH